ncbi:GNAT family N-acetyltransferase [Sphingobacterium tabacisoli]|uniref:GNAT family N-acetyltransferase n=1 Tax=Sphingobacterium tabacisoli TaxID=2044855 RepID=A0ABW5L588_9SPHI|nr:GNAT family N-acetyltransferase [Sphingobacterium tabacisoli]
MEIRSARMSDAPAITNLVGQLGYPAELATIKKRLSILLENQDIIVLVVIVDGGVVGWMQANYSISLEIDYGVEIIGLVVDDQWRGQGVGAALIREAVIWARQRDVGFLRVRCNVIRTESHLFYEKKGFTLCKEQKVFDMRL